MADEDSGPDWISTLSEAEEAVDKLDEKIRRFWRDDKNKRIQQACDSIELIAEFIYRTLRKTEVDEVVRVAVRKDKAYVAAFEEIHKKVGEFDSCLVAIGRSEPSDTLIETLTGLADGLTKDLDTAIEAFVAAVNKRAGGESRLADARSRALRVASDVQTQLRARVLVQDAERARDETVRLRDETKEAAGDAGANIFGAFYADCAKEEARTANWLRASVGALVVLVTAGAAVISFWRDGLSFTAELIRLSITIPVVLLAGYLAKESSRHRRSADQARELALAMKTLPAYLERFTESGPELHRALGMRIFGPATESPVDENGLFDNLEKVLDKLEQFVKRARDVTERQSK
jgi:hypothetical protein